MTFTREDIQHVSDMRLIALAKIQQWSGDPRAAAGTERMKRIVAACEEVIAKGPLELRHITEKVPSLEVIQHELRRSMFGRGSQC